MFGEFHQTRAARCLRAMARGYSNPETLSIVIFEGKKILNYSYFRVRSRTILLIGFTACILMYIIAYPYPGTSNPVAEFNGRRYS